MEFDATYSQSVSPYPIHKCDYCGKEDIHLMKQEFENKSVIHFHLDCYIKELVKIQVKIEFEKQQRKEDASKSKRFDTLQN